MNHFPQGGVEKALETAEWTEDSWGLTDYTLRCRAELPSQNLTTQFVVDRTGNVPRSPVSSGDPPIDREDLSNISLQKINKFSSNSDKDNAHN